MTIALGTNWGHNFTGAANNVATGSASPANGGTGTGASEWICGWASTSGTLTSVVDSVNGTIPPGQIISMGADPGTTGFNTYFFYELAASTAARTLTANTGSTSDRSSIIAFSFTGLAASSIVDQAPTPGHTGSGTTPLTNTTGVTQAASEVALFYWLLDHIAAATVWSGPPTINGFSGGSFAGLGNLGQSGAPQFDAGYYILSTSGQAGSASITSSLSDTWMGCIVTLSATPISGGPPAGLLVGQSGFASPW